MGKSEAFPNGSSHSKRLWKGVQGGHAMRYGVVEWRHGFGLCCPNQTNEELGVPGNDNRTRGGHRGSRRSEMVSVGLSEENFWHSPHLTACGLIIIGTSYCGDNGDRDETSKKRRRIEQELRRRTASVRGTIDEDPS